MPKYLLRRFAEMLITLFLIATATFFLLEAVPGDPLTERASKLSPTVKENLYKRYGLDKPMMERYVITMKGICKGEFGESVVYAGQTVQKLIHDRLPVSARLGIQQVLAGITIGLLLGILAAMRRLCQYVDVCISNEEDAKDVFGIEAEATDIYGGKLNAEGYKSVAKQLADKFHFEKVAITLRESHSAFDNGWSAMLYDVASNEYCFSKKYDLHIIDRVGGGDSFGGGLIYALLNGKSTQDAVEFAVAASALKHSIEGDYNMVTVSEVEKLAGGDGSGRIQR